MWMWHYTVDGRNPAPPFGSIKPVVNNGMFTYIYHINWCRISEPSTVSTVANMLPSRKANHDSKPPTRQNPDTGHPPTSENRGPGELWKATFTKRHILCNDDTHTKKNPAKRLMISIDIPWTLTWVFSKKEYPHPGEHMLYKRNLPNKSTTTWYPAFFNFVVPASVSPMKGRRYVGKPRPVATYLAPGMIGMAGWCSGRYGCFQK